MPVRRYISPVVGDGTDELPYRLKLADFPMRGHVATIPSNPDGTPKFGWGLAVVAATAAEHDAIAADAQIRQFPDIPLDAPVSTLSGQQRTRIRNFLEERGLDTAWITNATLFRQIVRFVGKHLSANYEEDLEAVTE